MKLGFVGLGQMGRPIAHNLMKSGAELIVSDRDERWFGEFRAKGAAASTSAAELADADVLFLCLPNSKVVQAFLSGDSGLREHLRQGQTDRRSQHHRVRRQPLRSAGAWKKKGWHFSTRRSQAWKPARLTAPSP